MKKRKTTPIFSKQWQRKRKLRAFMTKQGAIAAAQMAKFPHVVSCTLRSVTADGTVNFDFVYCKPTAYIQFTSIIDSDVLKTLKDEKNINSTVTGTMRGVPNK